MAKRWHVLHAKKGRARRTRSGWDDPVNSTPLVDVQAALGAMKGMTYAEIGEQYGPSPLRMLYGRWHLDPRRDTPEVNVERNEALAERLSQSPDELPVFWEREAEPFVRARDLFEQRVLGTFQMTNPDRRKFDEIIAELDEDYPERPGPLHITLDTPGGPVENMESLNRILHPPCEGRIFGVDFAKGESYSVEYEKNEPQNEPKAIQQTGGGDGPPAD